MRFLSSDKIVGLLLLSIRQKSVGNWKVHLEALPSLLCVCACVSSAVNELKQNMPCVDPYWCIPSLSLTSEISDHHTVAAEIQARCMQLIETR